MNGLGCGRHWPAGMNQLLEAVEHLTRPLEPDRADLDDPVDPCHKTGGLQVQGHELAIQARRRDQLVPLGTQLTFRRLRR